MERFQGGLVFKAHRLLYHSALGSRVIEKKKKKVPVGYKLGGASVGYELGGDHNLSSQGRAGAGEVALAVERH